MNTFTTGAVIAAVAVICVILGAFLYAIFRGALISRRQRISERSLVSICCGRAGLMKPRMQRKRITKDIAGFRVIDQVPRTLDSQEASAPRESVIYRDILCSVEDRRFGTSCWAFLPILASCSDRSLPEPAPARAGHLA